MIKKSITIRISISFLSRLMTQQESTFLSFFRHIFNPYCANCNENRLLFSSAEMFKKTSMSNSVDLDQSTLFASILNSSVMMGNYLQQTSSADYILVL